MKYTICFPPGQLLLCRDRRLGLDPRGGDWLVLEVCWFVVRCMIDRFVVSSSMILPAAGFQLLRGFLSRMESHARRSPPPIVSACRYVAARVESVLSETNFSQLSQAKCRSSELSLVATSQ